MSITQHCLISLCRIQLSFSRCFSLQLFCSPFDTPALFGNVLHPFKGLICDFPSVPYYGAGEIQIFFSFFVFLSPYNSNWRIWTLLVKSVQYCITRYIWKVFKNQTRLFQTDQLNFYSVGTQLVLDIWTSWHSQSLVRSMKLLNSWSCWDCLWCYQHYKVKQWTLDSSCGRSGTRMDFHGWWIFFFQVVFWFFFKSSSSLHVAQGSVSEAIDTLSGQLSFPVERGCWGMHWIHTSPHKSLGYLPHDLPSHRGGRSLGLLILLQTPSTAMWTASIHCEHEAGGIPGCSQQFMVLPNGSTSFGGSGRWPSRHKTAQELSHFLSQEFNFSLLRNWLELDVAVPQNSWFRYQM